ncbi:MAG: NAD-dependent epimerase/dehydratase family protein [Bacteroidia bacterium]|jgi:nucleoside-diphosphate-sugar epimerase|tara:strand:- start:2367 stop:3029 length:663 start_codon:yes stop_codon:yes gene_type:complete
MKVIITGSTGMVGRSVLNECLVSDTVQEVLVVNRRSVMVTHPKLTELLHSDFTDFSGLVPDLKGYDACFHCMGVSSVGKNEEEFTKLTYTVTKSLTDACHSANPLVVMTYVSGQGTDSTEQGNRMWARVKGKTENYILNKGVKDAYMFRLGALVPDNGVGYGASWYTYLYIAMSPLFPLLRRLNAVTTSKKLGKAMINAVSANQALKHLENKDINALSRE